MTERQMPDAHASQGAPTYSPAGSEISSDPVAAQDPGTVRKVSEGRRSTLGELLSGSEHLHELYRGLEGALDGDPIGDERS